MTALISLFLLAGFVGCGQAPAQNADLRGDIQRDLLKRSHERWATMSELIKSGERKVSDGEASADEVKYFEKLLSKAERSYVSLLKMADVRR